LFEQGLEGERNGTIDRLNKDINDLKQELESAREETSTGSHEAQALKIDLESKISQLEGEVSNQKREAQSATDKNDKLNVIHFFFISCPVKFLTFWIFFSPILIKNVC
jgi:outer membrane murein-binding lipoprotein Lpp